ncbi:hypothetical protein P3T73_03940 [Kiritimatiellota bacterium B12222]|nr:hypothetical protein P3T73_03940 [Kiritimatiellota bacterium B12222]
MKIHLSLFLFFITTVGPTLQAQLLDNGGALVTAAGNPIGSVGIQVEGVDRVLKDGSTRQSLSMTRVTVVAQTQIIPGINPWIEAGWHDPELLPGKSNGGFTWGAGLMLRPMLYPLRSDPTLGPRDWLAIIVDAAVRGGSAQADDNSEIEWMSLEAALGIEWRQVYVGRNNGPIGANGMNAGASILLNNTTAKQGSFDGSSDQNIGVRFMTGFTFGQHNFLSLEADIFGSSDGRIALVSGLTF